MYNEFSGEQPPFNISHEERQGASDEVGFASSEGHAIPSHGVGYTGAWRETNDAEKYLRRIADAPGASFHFRAIHDREKGRAAVNLYGTFDQCVSRLTRLNQSDFGIFVIINESSGTTDSTVTDIRCVFADLDRNELPERKTRLLYFAGSPISVNIKATTGLAPMSMIVESSPGKYHIYWKCHALPLDRFKSVQRELAHVLGGDPSVCNLSRVMRVPGFLHRKGEPFLSRVLHVRSGHPNSVSADNLERALARTMKKFKVKEAEAERAVVLPVPETPRDVLRGIQGIIRCVETEEQGNRNNLAYWAACRLKESVTQGWITARYAKELLAGAAQRAGLPDREAEGIIRSVWGKS
jgi:RepB DNA-primase from phage plasmid